MYDHYTGVADTLQEGERLAGVLCASDSQDPRQKHTVFMKNHGVLVTGNTIAQAYRRLYRLERVCRAQVHGPEHRQAAQCAVG